MVIHATIEHLKTRPHQERRDFATMVSVLVVGVLFIGWVILFVSNVRSDIAQQSHTNPLSQTSGAKNAVSISQQINAIRDSYTQATQVSPPAAPQVINIDTVPDVQ